MEVFRALYNFSKGLPQRIHTACFWFWLLRLCVGNALGKAIDHTPVDFNHVVCKAERDIVPVRLVDLWTGCNSTKQQ